MLIKILILAFIIIFTLYLYLISPRRSKRNELSSLLPLNFAHRGYFSKTQRVPENSLLAFELAIQKNMGIELDVHLTKDKQLVVFHDDTLERMCGLPQRVESTTYHTMQTLFLMGSSEKIPLLSEVLDLVDGKVPLLIELKMPTPNTTLCSAVYALLADYNGSFLIQSFNPLALRWFKKHAPHILRGQLSSGFTKERPSIPFIYCFLVQHLLTNCIARPDFITYHAPDTANISLLINRLLYKIPIGVWTLRSEEMYKKCLNKYSILIFEKFKNMQLHKH